MPDKKDNNTNSNKHFHTDSAELNYAHFALGTESSKSIDTSYMTGNNQASNTKGGAKK